MNNQFWETSTGKTLRWIGFVPAFFATTFIASFIVKLMCRLYKPEVMLYINENGGDFGEFYINGPIIILVLTIVPYSCATLISCFVAPKAQIAFGFCVALSILTIGLNAYMSYTHQVEGSKLASVIIQCIGVVISLAYAWHTIKDEAPNTSPL